MGKYHTHLNGRDHVEEYDDSPQSSYVGFVVVLAFLALVMGLELCWLRYGPPLPSKCLNKVDYVRGCR